MLKPGVTHQKRLSSVEEMERENTLQVSRKNRSDRERVRKYSQLLKPFGLQHDAWEEFKSLMEPTDELWEFCTDKLAWQSGLGLAGIELVRNGEVIAQFVTRMN